MKSLSSEDGGSCASNILIKCCSIIICVGARERYRPLVQHNSHFFRCTIIINVKVNCFKVLIVYDESYQR